ncbi:MAG: Xaa-Pro aminopeptidase, partial [Bacteroidota bacterium]
LTSAFVAGRSGNEILRRALDASAADGLRATIYTHPIGFYGHGAGPTIGLWDQQGGVPGRGDYPLYPMTAHAIELNTVEAVPEWGGQDVRFMLEEDAVFDGERVVYLDGRQTELLLIPRAD